jgi:hypothetical protein
MVVVNLSFDAAWAGRIGRGYSKYHLPFCCMTLQAVTLASLLVKLSALENKRIITLFAEARS